MPFNPRPEYTITDHLYSIKEFFDYPDDFIRRPPYQRKSVWSTKKKQALLDSLFRRYYVPKIVIREVRLSEDKTVSEIVDGQQRIITAQEFFDNKIKLPKSLKDLNPGLERKFYKELDPEMRRFIARELQYSADIVRGIEDPKNSEHQKIATEIFWRLQQGEPLNFMEIAHARLASLSRNFVVKYADDITFDFVEYKPIDTNPNKHKFFRIYNRYNNRMEHLLLLTRFLLLEEAKGPTELKDVSVVEFIDKYLVSDGVGNDSFENEPIAKSALSVMSAFYNIFKDDPMVDKDNGVKELSKDYLVISFYLLLRHLKEYYVIDDSAEELFRKFLVDEFYPRWSTISDNDEDVLLFSSSRQMDQKNIEIRDQVLRQLFFEFAKKSEVEVKAKDEKRQYNEAQKIRIYRRDKGLCQRCLEENKSEKESTVSWSEYEADHVLAHAKGGQTELSNAQVLCQHHNRSKSSL